jgi:hypothetical protein
MSNLSDSGLDLEELELQLLPSWAKQSAESNRYAAFEGAPGGGPDRGRDRRRPPGRSGDRPPGSRPSGEGARRRDDRDRGRPSRGPDASRGGRPAWEPKPPVPLPELGVALIPEAKGVESLARQIRLTGRAYPVFEIAQLILRKPERYEVRIETIRKGDQVAQPLWLCNLDDTLWLAEADAVSHVLQRHFGTFYQTEKTPTNPPKGTYTFVAQCGLSGLILGPPNFHDYQAKLLRLHASRFSRMPFEAYKSKVRIVRDEATVKKWIEDQSFKTEFVTLNVPEPVRLASSEEVEKHFREVHLANIIQSVENWSLLGPAAQNLPSLPLRQLVRRTWEEQRRFPLRLVGVLSQQLASHGLQFFKVNKTVTHVAVARPHYLDIELTPVSDSIRRIVEFINGHAGCTRRKLMEALAPAPPPTPVPVVPVEAPPADEVNPPERGPATPPVVAAVADAPPPPTPEQTVVTADLHWLIHQGHVIEFANGRLETAKKPKPKPVRPEKPAGESAQESVANIVTTAEGAEPEFVAKPAAAESTAGEAESVAAPEASSEAAARPPAAGVVSPQTSPTDTAAEPPVESKSLDPDEADTEEIILSEPMPAVPAVEPLTEEAARESGVEEKPTKLDAAADESKA